MSFAFFSFIPTYSYVLTQQYALSNAGENIYNPMMRNGETFHPRDDQTAEITEIFFLSTSRFRVHLHAGNRKYPFCVKPGSNSCHNICRKMVAGRRS